MSARSWILYILFYVVVFGIGIYLALPVVTGRAEVDRVGPDVDSFGYPCPMKGCEYDFYGKPCLYEDCHLSHLEWGHYPMPD